MSLCPCLFFFSSRRRHTRCALVTGVQTCALPIYAPARIEPVLAAEAERIARELAEGLDYVGVLAVELFDCGDHVLVNEMAPRVHNSGHWTMDAAVTSQFEQHIRRSEERRVGKAGVSTCRLRGSPYH